MTKVEQLRKRLAGMDERIGVLMGLRVELEERLAQAIQDERDGHGVQVRTLGGDSK